MTVGEAIAVARAWVQRHVATNPDLVAAYLAGSLTRLAPDTPMPSSSDVDVHVIQPRRGTWSAGERYRGALIQCTVTALDLTCAEAVLADPFESHGVLFGAVLADPRGVLARLRGSVASAYADDPWVAARCEGAVQSAHDWLDLLDRQADSDLEWASAILAWAVSGLAAALALAALREPGGRKCLLMAREVLYAAGRPELHERLLAALGVDQWTSERVDRYHREGLDLFDRAVAVHRTRVPGDDQLHEYYRPYVTAGAQEIIDQGHHREAMWRIHRTCYPACRVLLADAPHAERLRCRAWWSGLRRDLGLETEREIRNRGALVRALAGDILSPALGIARRHASASSDPAGTAPGGR